MSNVLLPRLSRGDPCPLGLLLSGFFWWAAPYPRFWKEAIWSAESKAIVPTLDQGDSLDGLCLTWGDSSLVSKKSNAEWICNCAMGNTASMAFVHFFLTPPSSSYRQQLISLQVTPTLTASSNSQSCLKLVFYHRKWLAVDFDDTSCSVWEVLPRRPFPWKLLWLPRCWGHLLANEERMS